MVSSTEETIEVLTAWQVRKSPVHVEVADAGIRISFDGFVGGVNIGALELRNTGCHLVLMLMDSTFEYESEATLSSGERDYMTAVLKVLNPRSPTRSVVIYELAA